MWGGRYSKWKRKLDIVSRIGQLGAVITSQPPAMICYQLKLLNIIHGVYLWPAATELRAECCVILYQCYLHGVVVLHFLHFLHKYCYSPPPPCE
jgi:hypothetical protein